MIRGAAPRPRGLGRQPSAANMVEPDPSTASTTHRIRGRLRRRRRLWALALALVAGVLTLVALEISFRIVNAFTHFMDRYDPRRIVEVYAAHPYLSHTLTPEMDYLRPA